MSVTAVAPPHPILACVAALDAALDQVADVQPIYLTTPDKRQAIVDLARLRARLAELELRVLSASAEVGDQSGARDAAAWVAHATRSDPRAARADAHLARAVDAHPLVAAGMRRGGVSVEQARVVVHALDELPSDLDPGVRAEAEATMVGHCADFAPRELRRLGRRLVEVVAPEVADAEDGKWLEAQERRARERASLRFQDLGDGRSRIWGLLPTPAVQRLQHYLQAYTSPRRPGEADGSAGGAPDAGNDAGNGAGVRAAVAGPLRVPQHRAYAHAFCALLEALDPDRLPEHGGDATTVVVTLGIDQLRAELAAAGVIAGDDHETISAGDARRLACQAKILPVVLGARGEVLDLGRSRRLFSRAQRRAIRFRDRGCRAEGCTIPAAWTEAHHLRPWSAGGPTDLDNAVSLCGHHHRRIHDSHYETHRLPQGDIRFHRRT